MLVLSRDTKNTKSVCKSPVRLAFTVTNKAFSNLTTSRDYTG